MTAAISQSLLPAAGEGETVLGRYRIVRRLATGGMGVVYLARIEGAEGFARPAVIKRMLPELSNDEELVRLFVREAQILAGLRHPGIVSVLDFAAEPQGYLMALEYVHGFHAGHWLKYLRKQGQRFSPALAIHVMVQTLEALEYVHTQTDPTGKPLGIVHRDVSPSNIVIDLEGHVRLLDFGVARVSGEVTAAKEGEVSLKGKFPYLAPELLSQAQPSPRSDLYAAGVVLHELLTGENEFKRPDATETLRRVLLHELSSVEDKWSDVPKGLDSLIRRATARDPENRPSSAGELAQSLRALLKDSDSSLRAELRERARKDFLGPMPEMLKLTPLDELERAWREAPIPKREPTGPVVQQGRNSDMPTLTVTAPTRGARWPFFVFGVVALLGLVVGLVALLRPNRAPPPVVVVERERLGPADPGHGPTPPTPEHPGTEPIVPPDPNGQQTPPPPPNRQLDLTRQLTRTFNQQGAADLRRCFERHAQQLEGTPQLSIRFHIRADGLVDQADLFPPELASTSLGMCVLGVARATHFDPQPGPLGFRIPLTVRTGTH